MACRSICIVKYQMSYFSINVSIFFKFNFEEL